MPLLTAASLSYASDVDISGIEQKVESIKLHLSLSQNKARDLEQSNNISIDDTELDNILDPILKESKARYIPKIQAVVPELRANLTEFLRSYKEREISYVSSQMLSDMESMDGELDNITSLLSALRDKMSLMEQEIEDLKRDKRVRY